jgi:ribosome-binding protein aMBF1 (putative translation factor)
MSATVAFRAQFREIRSDLRYVMQDLGDLLPLVRRTRADRWEAQAEQRGFELGRGHEAQRREAPAVGAVLRTTREAMSLSVAQVAERASVEAEYLERVEQGTEFAPEVFTRRLAEILGQWMAEVGR